MAPTASSAVFPAVQASAKAQAPSNVETGEHSQKAQKGLITSTLEHGPAHIVLMVACFVVSDPKSGVDCGDILELGIFCTVIPHPLIAGICIVAV